MVVMTAMLFGVGSTFIPKAEAQTIPCCFTLRWKTKVCNLGGNPTATCGDPDPQGPCVRLKLCYQPPPQIE